MSRPQVCLIDYRSAVASWQADYSERSRCFTSVQEYPNLKTSTPSFPSFTKTLSEVPAHRIWLKRVETDGWSVPHGSLQSCYCLLLVLPSAIHMCRTRAGNWRQCPATLHHDYVTHRVQIEKSPDVQGPGLKEGCRAHKVQVQNFLCFYNWKPIHTIWVH